MRNTRFFPAIVLFLISLSLLTAQQKAVTLEEIWTGSFSTEGLEVLRSLKNGNEYAVLNHNRNPGYSSIDVYSYQSGEKTKNLLHTDNLEGINRISSYELSADESKILFSTELEPIYRRSKKGIYYVYDTRNKTLNLVSPNKIQEPAFSNDGSKVAFVYENNIFIKDLNSGNTTRVTSDGKKNAVINGITDWVYEEEFAFVRAFEWSVRDDKIAFIRFDESEVPEFGMDIYGSGLYPYNQTFKYPKAGEVNSDVSLHVYDLKSEKTWEIDLSDYESYYIPRLLWTRDNDVVSVQLTNRHQNQVDLVFVNVAQNSTRLVLKETDPAYVDITDNLFFMPDNSFFWTSEKDGWNHIYQYNRNGKLMNQTTQGKWEVTRFYGFDSKTGRVYYQSTENGSMNRDVFSILPDGKNKIRLTPRSGTNSASFSADFSYFINTFSNSETPYIYSLHESRTGKLIREIKNNEGLKNRLTSYRISPKEFSSIRISGEDLNMYMIKPLDFDENKKYPLFLYQYSGPGSQSVSNSWMGANDYWHQMLANEHDVIVVCVDGRGTGFKGSKFKKMTQLELGKYEVEDQIRVAEKLGSRSYIDPDRIGIWGWSYGGFMSANCLFQAPEVFKMAIAVAPVSSWRFYDTIYTERYMKTPQENPEGYDHNSPLFHVNKLKGNFLLIHGSADDNVHVQNAMQLAEALIQANKKFDWRIYPDKNHGIYGGYTRLHLYTLMTDYIKNSL